MKRLSTSLLLVALACTFGLLGGGVATYIRAAIASRNSSGTMAAINGPYTSGSTISSSAVNARLSDIESELTDSKSRSGKGDFTAPVRVANGLVSAPSFSFTNDTGSGLYRIGSSDLGWAINGTKELELTGSLFTVVPDATLFNATVKLRLDGATIGGGLAGIWAGAGAAAPTTTNYILAADGAGNTSLNSATTINLNVAGSNVAMLTSTGFATASGKTLVATSGITVGASGTTTSRMNFGVCALNGGSPATCTAAVASGATCTATIVGVTPGSPAVGVSGTTLTITSTNGRVDNVNWVCF